MKYYFFFALLYLVFLTKLQAQSHDPFSASFPVESSSYNRDAIEAEIHNPVSPPPLKLKHLEEDNFNLDTVEYKSDELEISPESASFRTGAFGKNTDIFSQMTSDNKITPISHYIENKKEKASTHDMDSIILFLILGVIIIIVLVYLVANVHEKNSDSNNNFNPFTDKIVFNYHTIKFTNEIVFKPIQIGKADVYIDRFELTIYPYNAYSGIYNILKSQKVKTGVLNTVSKITDKSKPFIGNHKTYYIHVSETGDIIKIFDENRLGIILKF